MILRTIFTTEILGPQQRVERDQIFSTNISIIFAGIINNFA